MIGKAGTPIVRIVPVRSKPAIRFGRMLVAQGMVEPLHLLPADENIGKYTSLTIKA